MKKIVIAMLLLSATSSLFAGGVMTGSGPMFLTGSAGMTVYSITTASQSGTVVMYYRDVTGTTMNAGPVKLTVTSGTTPLTLITGAPRLGPLGILDGLKFTNGIVLDASTNTVTVIINGR